MNDSHGGFRNMPPNSGRARAGHSGQAALPEHGLWRGAGRGGCVSCGLPLTCPGARHSGAHHQQLCLCPSQAQRHGAGRGWHLRCAGRCRMAYRCSWARRRCIYRRDPPLFPQAVYVQTKRATGQGSGISLSRRARLLRPSAPVWPRLCSSVLPAAHRSIDGARARSRSKPRPPRWPTCFAVAHPGACGWATCCDSHAPDTESAVRMINCLSAMSSMLR